MGRRNVLLSEHIFERLETDISARVYPPGSHLTEDEVAAQLGTSRTPVREAFRMLQRAGWLDIYPHSGAYVRKPSLEEARQVFDVRECLEERAAQLAARHATEPDRRDMRKIMQKGWRDVERGNAKLITARNSAFHSVVARAGRNEILARILEELNKQVRWHFTTVATVRGADSWKEHEQMLKAIESGDWATAGELAVEHTRRTQEAFFIQLLGTQSLVSAEDSSD